MPDMAAPNDPSTDINAWLTRDARRSGNPAAVVEGYLERLQQAGVSVSRARIAQRLANPLLSAWGIIWTPDGAREYEVPRSALLTSAWQGSPFQHVLENNRPLHKSLLNLTPADHHTYHELAETGGTDFYVTILDYGDGSSQACSFLTGHGAGFSAENINLIERTRYCLASALEPIAMRRSTDSLLKVYLGQDPARAVISGAIERGQQVHTRAAIMFADLRGFTEKSVSWPESALLSALDDYFEAVVEAVHKNAGDVLKLMGDGVLAMFQDAAGANGCRNAVMAAGDALAGLETKNQDRLADEKDPLQAGFGLSFGPVSYGNIGSPDRLDFTIVGAAVNRASRIQDLCKTTGRAVLMGSEVAERAGIGVEPVGTHRLRGMPQEESVFAATLDLR